MAPSRPKPQHNGAQDDARSDTSGPPSGRPEVASKTINAAEKRKATAALTVSTSGTHNTGGHAHDGIEGLAWDRMPSSLLQSYRSSNNLRTPSGSCQYSHAVLSSGIGKKSPSYRHRQSQDALISVVRRHFNNQAINEHEVVVNFLYAAKNNDKAFRLRFPPNTHASVR